MKNKKHVLCFYQVYENDALKNYLEHMAQKGWKLTGFDNFFLHFQACSPHPIRYCVEVMENASPYASNQSPSLIQYREFCRDAGWDYKGTNGYLHVFSTDDTEAIPVETDSRERYENICRASAGVYRSFFFLFLLLGPLNLYICYQKGTLFNAHGAAVLLFLGATVWSVGDFLLWKHRARLSLENTGFLPLVPWKSVFLKNVLAALLVLLFALIMFSATFSGIPSRTRSFILPYFLALGILFLVFSGLISLLREKYAFSRKTNIMIYWGVALVLTILFTGIFSAAVFSSFR